MSKSTPGPWEAITNRPHEEHKWMIANRSWSNWPIATEMKKEDARLIAAAPELLDALRRLYDAGLDHDLARSRNGCADVMELASSAIRKAEGAE